IWNDLSPGTLLVFSFYMLGVGHATIARELGITDRALMNPLMIFIKIIKLR
ncbi:TPA: conjugal transfer protein TraJ, partial [Escherichia coli]|nr:conjugal transfer protein TraJ [Escherichia coli]